MGSSGSDRDQLPGVDGLPAALAAHIAQDLQGPARPPISGSAIGLRLLVLLLVAQVAAAGLAFVMGLRAASDTLLVAPALAATLALALGSLALGREAIPGRGPAFGIWLLALSLGGVAFAALVVLQQRWALGGPLAHPGGPGCMVIGSALGIVPLIAGLTAVRKGYAVRPVLAGAALGALGGVVGVTTLHLHCPDVALAHTATMHGGVIVLLAVVGALVGRSALRLRRAARRPV